MKTTPFFLRKPDGLHLAFLLACLLFLYLTYGNGMVNILKWDLFGHYAYLPMLFQSGEIAPVDLSYFEKINSTYQNTPYLYQFVLLDNGVYITKYTSGWAVLLSPFYFIADIWAQNSAYAKDGFSYPYQLMLSVGCAIYICSGLYLLQKILRHLFELRVAIITFCLIVIGTNWLFMNYAALGSSNNIEFFLIAWMLWMCIRFHETEKFIYAFGLGIAIGLIGLVRPPDLILALLPIGWNMNNYGSLWQKIRFFLREKKVQLALAFIPAIALLSIQLLYWKITSGHFLMNSYANNAGEGFDWFSPYLLEVLFSFRKGWLLYTPLMIFALIGLYRWSRSSKHGLSPILLFIIFLYVVSCWTCWYYAESFSQRALIDAYPLLAIGLAYFIQQLFYQKKTWVFAVIALFLSFNLFQTYQMEKGILHGSRMTQAYYFSVFGQTQAPTPQQNDLLLIDRNIRILEGFTDEHLYKKCYQQQIKFPPGTELNAEEIYSPVVEIIPSDVTEKDHFWTRAIWKYEGTTEQLKGKIINATAMYKSKAYQYIGYEMGHPLLKVDTLKKEITMDYISPEFRTPKDPIRLGIWNQSGLPLKLLWVKISCFERRD